MWLQCAILAVLPLCHIEDDGVGVKLWRHIAVHGPRSIMLELCGDKLRRRLRRMIAADPCLGVVLQLLQRHANTIAMCIAHTVITADQRGQWTRISARKMSRPIRPDVPSS